ncbi:MBL fold metallo-hydrolase [Allomuricauda sp. SCSIO 65647]|uniref:MBL fold metallo-hydrolase n=1 Tax=Allomuricauda sp. SCSIO 65647 TaxID=2908843 RepID=UPI001F2F68BB|nr:MBL fold metallo-hydrolase [Muricauda sp. SCSIO 65647]UJH67352.1 MBL fold metallo-hydrolase [Muricauda sp. SCSIO 65647]
MLLSIVILIASLVIIYLAFVNFYPSFGGDVSKERKALYLSSKQFKDGAFVNTKEDIPEDASFSEMLSIARKFFFQKVENGRPEKELEVQKIDSIALAGHRGGTQLVWFGHSAFLLQMNGKNILIDPMFGKVPAPHPWFGANRFTKELPIEIEKLPKIDAVVISHDHYDHLDYGSIKKLKDKVEAYYVPLGVGVHLEAWGVGSDRITEMDWWEETMFEDIQLACTPAQHFSGRKFTNGQSTLWSSWVIKSDGTSIYFSGDGGYGPHFKQIGEQYGPFDFAMMECGQYNKMWPDIHMFPEETAQAGVDVQAKALMAIHWGAFKLALHSWTDPIERVSKKAKELQIPLVTPQIGEPIVIDELPKPNRVWW